MNHLNSKCSLKRGSVVFAMMMFVFGAPATFAEAEQAVLAEAIEALVKSYNDQDAEAYRKPFGDRLKEKFSLEDIQDILSSNMKDNGPIVDYDARISPSGRRALVILQMEEAAFDLHIRTNSDGLIERLSWFPHKSDPLEDRLSDDEVARYRKRYQPVVDEFARAIRDTNAELVMSLFAEDEDDDWTTKDYRSFLEQINSRGKINGVGELEISEPGEVLLPIFFESADMGFYLNFDKGNKISGIRISNYAPSESVGKSLSDLGEDTLRTTDLLQFSQLEEAFKRDSGKVRFITLLSPT